MEYFIEIIAISLLVTLLVVGFKIFVDIGLMFLAITVPVSVVYLAWKGVAYLCDKT